MYVLVEEGTEKAPRRFPVRVLPAVVGRSPSAAVRITDASVSREHARLFEREGRLHVADLNARNGTFLNGKRVTLAPVAEGDELRLGRVRLRVKRAAGAVPPTAPVTPPVQEAPSPPTASPPPRPPPPSRAPGGAGPEIHVKEDLLQYTSRKQGRGRRSVLAHDFSQYGGSTRILIWLLLLALAAGTFFIFRWIGGRVVPEGLSGPGDTPPGYEDPLPRG